MNLTKEEFPILQPSHKIDHHNYFQETIVSIYFQLQRNHNFSNVHTLYNKVVDLFKLLYSKKDDKSLFRYVNVLYRMIGQTRNVIHGKGEHDMTYLLILAFYTYDPSYSLFALHRLVYPLLPDVHVFGSWRDLPYFCDFVRNHASENHALIYYAIELMNNQLYRDYITYQFSKNQDSPPQISNVCKWIPREHKKFDWLYEKLAFHWSKTHKSYLFDDLQTHVQFVKVSNKMKKIYRKTCSLLNKQIHTLEIDLCNKDYENIYPKKVGLQSTIMYYNLFLQEGEDYQQNKEKMKLIEKFDQFFDELFEAQEHVHYIHDYPKVNHISLFHFVNHAIDANQSNDLNKIYFLNKLWEKSSPLIPHFQKDYFIPVVDVSLSMQYENSECFYSSLGLAILLSQNSLVENRIIAMDSYPSWIIFESKLPFTKRVAHFLKEIKSCQNTKANYVNVVDLISHACSEVKTSPYFTKQLHIVFFSAFTEFEEFSFQFLLLFQRFKKAPQITFWNTSNQGVTDFPFTFSKDRYLYMTGYNMSILKEFIKTNKIIINKPNNAFEFIEKICEHPMYDVLSQYLIA